MSYWATPPMDRNQVLLFSPTLDATIGQDHPVRLFDEVLSNIDWSLWEARYDGKRGQPLNYTRSGSESRRGSPVRFRIYSCVDCEDCPLSSVCRRSEGPRTVRRDQHEALRESVSSRMRSESGQEEYDKRKWICETPFGLLKGIWRLRQFVHRGPEKVKTEWSWTCTAYNLAKLVREVARLRVQFAAATV